MGPEVASSKAELAAFGEAHALSCANGTDALALPLMALGIGPRRRGLLCPPSPSPPPPRPCRGSTPSPVFVDVDAKTYNLDPGHLEAAIEAVKGRPADPRVVIAVDLFGQPADYPAIKAICDKRTA
jgi:UDP-2-acetamido-2-deoxy-ribo-hexuluronate aminotransferase